MNGFQIPRRVLCAVVFPLLCALGGCSQSAARSSVNTKNRKARNDDRDPVRSFEQVVAGMQQRIATPREYLQCRRGTFPLPRDFAGPPELAGKPFESYDKLRVEFEVVGYDVKKTDSLVSPYEAVVVVRERELRAFGAKKNWDKPLQKPEDVLGKPYTYVGKWYERKATYSWRDEQWVPTHEQKTWWPYDPAAIPVQEQNGGVLKGTGTSWKRLK